MTDWSDVENKPGFIKILDHGFVGLIDHMGSDQAIVQAARVSYGAGTKSVNEDRGLIRYLFSHHHMSPFEMCEAKFMLKLPIFVMRQLVRHRTASLNEYSGRYSLMSSDFYIPEIEHIKPQSKDNKQGRGGEYPESVATAIQSKMRLATKSSFETYENLLDDSEHEGLARELARTVLPLGNYTELYWKQDLRCLLHLIYLREDSHAQYEIQEVARAMKQLIVPLFPLAIEAFEDYQQNAKNFSAMELELMKSILIKNKSIAELLDDEMKSSGLSELEFAKKFKMTKRELSEFKSKF